MEFRLIVLRTSETKELAEFYSLFGLKFDYHQHGQGPYHYSTFIGQTVLEIYPLTKTQKAPDSNLRIGFSIENFDLIVEKLKELKTVFALEPTQTNFGFMAVVEDIDGRKVELYKK